MKAKFASLWKSHPNTDNLFSSDMPCSSEYQNQCAIRMGQSIHGAGVNMQDFQGARCGFADHQPRHVLRARELASWIKRNPAIFGVPLEIRKDSQTSQDFYEMAKGHVSGRTGIIYFEDFWAPDGVNRTGDHIDLWNKYHATLWWTALTYLKSDHFRESRRIVFWELND
jgi:hypothetical protein